MLVLSREKNESIVINGNVTVTVVDIVVKDEQGHLIRCVEARVRLGIVAPREVPVYPHEVYEAICKSPPENPKPS